MSSKIDNDSGLETPEMPFDRPATLGGASDRRRVAREVPCGGAALAKLAQALGVSAEEVTLTAWTVVLATYSRRSGLITGVVSRGTTMALEVEVHSGLSFRSLTNRVSDFLATSLKPSSSTPAVFVLDAVSRGLEGVPSTTPFVAGLEHAAEPALLTGWYDPARFERATAGRIVDHLANVLSCAIESDAEVLVGEIDVLPAGELHLLQEWNSTAADLGSGTLVSLFTREASRSPDSTALEFGARVLSYGELAQLARRVAGRLMEMGVGRGSMVGVLCEPSAELVAALYGVMTAGAAYVPLDPEYPVERLKYMIEETGMSVVLCQARFRGLLTDPGPAMLDVDEVAEDAHDTGEVLLPEVTPDDVAYVIYTSGSTGRPKGVANAHRGVVNQSLWMQDRFGLGPTNVVLQKTPFSFDLSVSEFFWPLQVGARLVVTEPGGHRDPAYLVETIVRHEVDTIHFVPTMLQLFLDHPAAQSCTSLRRVICIGEALTRDLQERFFEILPDAELHNTYGPTEAAVQVTAWRCRRDDHLPVVPIGAPMANTRIHILDDRLRPAPIGLPGELYIGGVQVAVGYLNRDDLTAERFISDPFDPSGRLYKTGDLARWLPSGQVDFMGRIDHQVKIRGQRVELGEVEAVLGEHPSVLEAAVTVVDSGREARLVAHVMWRGLPAAESELRASLEARLPAHMIPAHFISHDALPLTTSGKVDRNVLGMLPIESRKARPTVVGRNDLERFLLEVWSSVLERADVGRDDRVFDLGATSLQAAAFVNRLQRELGEVIYVVSVFTAPTVGEYAAYLTRQYPEAVARRFEVAIAGERTPADHRIDESSIRLMSDIVPRFGPYPSWRHGQRNRSAVFILAPPRSGTTLLRVMLAGHPRLFAASELQLLGFDTLSQRRAALDGRFSLWREGAIRAVMDLEGCDAESATCLMESFERNDLTSKEFWRWLQSRAGDRVLIDKSPAYALDLETLRNAEHGFDAPRYIHLVREPFAMSRSFESYHMDQVLFVRDHLWSSRTLGELVWTVSHRNILKFAEEVPESRLLRVRFEDLLGDPRAVMTEVAAFLGVKFEEILVHPYERLETKMVDGLYPESTPMGDTKLLERDRIDPDVVSKWVRPGADSPLGEPTLHLAQRLGYRVPERSAEVGGRRRFADAARRRRATRSSRG